MPAPTRILIVDDHKIIRESLRRLLGDQSDIVVVGDAGDSESAWKAVEQLRPDLVLMDLELPGEGGVALTRRICGALPDTKVVVLTGQLGTYHAREAIAAGACGYLVKTGGGQEILTAVRTVRQGQAYLNADTTIALIRPIVPAPAGGPAAEPPSFSEREKQVLRLLVDGLRNKEIAVELNVGIKTVETYRSRLMKKLGCASTAEMVRSAIRHGLVKP